LLRRLFALVVLTGLIAGGLYYWKAGGRSLAWPGLGEPGGALGDAKTTLSVKTALGLVRALQPYRLEVGVEDGVVTLRGELPGEDLRVLAAKTAAAVPFVRQVVDHLKVHPGIAPPAGSDRTLGESLDDRALEVQVRLAFSLNREMEGADVEVRAFRRVVTLAGQVASPAQKRAAVELARQTAQVAEVVDQIQLRGAAAGGNRLAAVEVALAANPNLAAYRLGVRETPDGLEVFGRVRSSAEKDLAGMIAREAAGGGVRNAVQVRP
jgi:osmotically-inducible protein OsmY